MMHPYYAKQILEYNKENIKSIVLEADWILSFDDMNKLGNEVKEKMIQKIAEIEKQNKELLEIINEK